MKAGSDKDKKETAPTPYMKRSSIKRRKRIACARNKGKESDAAPQVQPQSKNFDFYQQITQWSHNRSLKFKKLAKIVLKPIDQISNQQCPVEKLEEQLREIDSSLESIDKIVRDIKFEISLTKEIDDNAIVKLTPKRKFLQSIMIPVGRTFSLDNKSQLMKRKAEFIPLKKVEFVQAAKDTIQTLRFMKYILLERKEKIEEIIASQTKSSIQVVELSSLSPISQKDHSFVISLHISNKFINRSKFFIRLPVSQTPVNFGISKTSLGIEEQIHITELSEQVDEDSEDEIILTRALGSLDLAQRQASPDIVELIPETNHNQSIVEFSNNATPPRIYQRFTNEDRNAFESLLQTLELNMKTCQSCLGLFFNEDISELQEIYYNKIESNHLQRINTGVIICKSCLNQIKDVKIPGLYCTDGMMFPRLPLEIHILNEFEAALVAPRIPFMKLRSEINPGRQFSIVGNVHNIAINLGDSIKNIIELTDRHSNFFLKLKRKREFERAYMVGEIDIHRIHNALETLLRSELYVQENIQIDLNQFLSIFEQVINQSPTNHQYEQEQELFTNIDFNHAEIVPGEYGYYMDLVADVNGEWLTFPKIYCGKQMDYGTLSYKKQCLSEIRRDDERCRRNISKLFYSYMKLISKTIQASINYLFYQTTFSSNVTVRQARNPEFIRQAINRNDVDAVLRGVPTSPKFWLDRKRELVGMIIQLGPPSFFITLSPEEIRDDFLITFLQFHAKNYSYDLTKNEKEKLIAKDPVMLIRYTERKFRKTIEQSILNRFSTFRYHIVKEFFIRVEFQKRGSPHIHMLVWCENVQCSKLSDEEISQIADRYICVERPENFEMTKNNITVNIKTQVHKHMTNCKTDPQDLYEKCQKSFPRPVINRTIVLHPDLSNRNLNSDRDNYTRIQVYLENIPHEENDVDQLYTYETILNDLEMTEEQYFSALSSTIKSTTIFIKRKASEIFINNYNKEIMCEHKSNMDIQLITDSHGLAEYVTSYMMKGQFEAVENLERIIQETADSRMNRKRQLEIVKAKYQNLTKVSAQECAYTLLGYLFVKSSRSFGMVNTEQTNNRKLVLKKKEILNQMQPDSVDIFKTSLQEYYSKRPDSMSEICLADFATGYSLSVIKRRITPNEQLSNNESRFNVESIVKYQPCNRKILLATFTDINRNTSDHLSQLLKLYLPWRDEQLETETANNQRIYDDNIMTITRNKSIFEFENRDNFELALLNAQEKAQFFAERLVPLNQEEIVDAEDLEDEMGFQVSPHNEATYTGRRENMPTVSGLHQITEMTPFELDEMLERLNIQQRIYLDLFTIAINNDSPFYHCIQGGAGTGKSFLINAIVQKFSEITRLNGSTIILAAQTGKAAFNINGCTLHTAFGIPLKSLTFAQLTHNRLKILQRDYKKLKLIIIDEISLVGEKMFSMINLRLQQIFENNRPFGGISVITVGDFQQLRPVQDNWIFLNTPEIPYNNWKIFKWYKLTEIMRQREDQQWAIILTKIARSHFYELTEQEIRIVESRIFFISEIPESAVFLCYSNNEVEQMNTQKISLLQGDIVRSEAVDRIEGENLTEHEKTRILNNVKAQRNYMETGSLPSLLNVKVGVKYMLTRNLKVTDGLVNGAVGICRHIILSEENQTALPKVKRIYLEFLQQSVGSEIKLDENHIRQRENDNVFNENLIGINCDKITLKMEKNRRDFRIKRVQLPLVECEALTIHKSQGQTYPSIALNIGKPLTKQLLYVALSRVPCINNLYLYGKRTFVPGPIKLMSQEEKEEKIQEILANDTIHQEIKRVTDNNDWL